MQRYFVMNNNIENNSIRIVDEDAHHISKVMRFQQRDILLCIDEDANSYKCAIEDIGNNYIIVKIIDKIEESNEADIDITIYQALIKSDKMEWVIQKGTELGVKSFVPVSMTYSIAKIDTDRQDKKINRWQKIAKEAAEQSERNIIPHISQPMTFEEMIADINMVDTLPLLAYERSKHSQGILSLIKKYPDYKKFAIIIGPEGGLCPEEIDLAHKSGIHLVNLGPRILRTETAAIVAVSGLMFNHGQLGEI